MYASNCVFTFRRANQMMSGTKHTAQHQSKPSAGHARFPWVVFNGFQPKTVNTRVGSLELAVPQTRRVAFYPSSLERGTRSEQALKLVVAEMHLPGVSTGKVTVVMEELCGLEVTSTQVSRSVQALDAELQQWRERPLG
jgi:transposase-like protein